MTSKNRKHLDDEQLTNPEPEGEQKISRVLDIRGGNIVEIEYSDKRTTLCMIPSKYRKKLWIRKGSFLIVDPAPADDNYKVQARIAHVLNADQVKHLKSTKLFPEEFLSASDLEPETQVDPFGIQGNPNRRTALVDDEDSDDDEDDDSDDDNDDDSDDEDSE